MAMKTSICIAAVLLIIDLLLILTVPAKCIGLPGSNDGHEDRMAMKLNSINGEMARKMRLMRRPGTLDVAGSSLPDCSHACGSCSPCRLVMVSLVCASLAEAETCPISYKCMCNSKSYPVP